jgi:hypothetical protein
LTPEVRERARVLLVVGAVIPHNSKVPVTVISPMTEEHLTEAHHRGVMTIKVGTRTRTSRPEEQIPTEVAMTILGTSHIIVSLKEVRRTTDHNRLRSIPEEVTSRTHALPTLRLIIKLLHIDNQRRVTLMGDTHQETPAETGPDLEDGHRLSLLALRRGDSERDKLVKNNSRREIPDGTEHLTRMNLRNRKPRERLFEPLRHKERISPPFEQIS